MGSRLAGLDRIHQVVFELEFDEATQADAFQDRIGAFCRLHLADALGAGMRAVPHEGVPLVLERLELELGSLDPDTPEHGLERRIATAFAAALAAQFAAAAPHAQHAQHALPAPPHQARPGADELAAFLADGGRWNRAHADRVIATALARDPSGLALQLRAHGGGAQLQRALAHTLSRGPIEGLVRLLDPGAAPVTIGYVDDMVAVQEARPLLPLAPAAIEPLLWELVLAYLLQDRGSRFNMSSFIAATVRGMAQRCRLDYHDLVRRLAETAAAQALPSAARYSLPAILAGLRTEPAPPDAGTASLRERTRAEADLAALGAFFERGLLPTGLPRGDGPAQMIARLAARQPAALAALIRHAGAREAARQRLVDGLGEPAREQVLELLEPVHGRQIVTHVRALRAARARQALPARAERSYTRDLWQLVFASVLAERGSVFNTRSFIRQLLTGMAARHGISYRTLLLDLVAQAQPTGPPASLPAVLHWLAEEELLGITDFTEPGRGADRLADETTQDALERLLRHGLRPPFPGAAPDAALAAWLARIPAASLAGAIRRRGTERAPLERVAWQFGTPFLEQALAALAGSQAAAVAGLRTALQARLAVSGADSRWLDLHLLAWLARRPAARVDMAAMSAQVTAALALRLGLGQDRLLASLARQWRPPLHAALPVLAAADARTLALYYLEHGCLPATAAGLAPVQWQRLLEHGMAVVSSERMLAALRTMGEAATERVLRHVPRARLLRMLKRAGPAQAPIVEGMLAGLRQAFAREPGLDGRAADAVAGVARLLRYGSAGKAGALQAALARALAADAPALHARLLEAAGQDLERARLAQALAAPASAGVLRLLLGGEAGSAGAHRRLLALSSLLQRVLQQRAPARFGAIAVDELLRYIRLHGQHHGRAGAEPAACLRAVLARLAAEGLPAAALAGVTAGVTAGVAGRRGRWGTALREGLRQAGRDRAATALSAAAPAHPAPAVPVRRGEPLPVLPEGERFYVDNAGAVLLWPFLDRYFRTLGLMEGRDFRDDACRARAACLLQYLVDSDEDPPEYAMLLNKLLCGIAPTAPLAWTGPPDEAARTLARQLLHSVTQTWRMLKNTSIEGLQETFLARGGMLLRVDEQWTLTVDKGPFDMLLQSLPWGLSTVRLSWMESALWVKWR